MLVKTVMNPWKLAMLSSGTRAPYVDVSFFSRDNLMHAQVPSKELWVAVKDVLVFEDYELDPLFKFTALPRGAVVIDAGAFVGLFSLKVSSFVGKVVAIEPSRENFLWLQRNLSSNRAPNVEARRVALSSTPGTIGFLDGGTSSTMVKGPVDKSYSVEGSTLEELVDELGHVDLLKMDIEGAEYDVLLSSESSTLSRVDRIVAELHFFSESDRIRSEALLETLKNEGMTVRTVAMPRNDRTFGLIKPWRCSLHKFNGKSTFPYRLLIATVYGLAPFGAAVRSSYDFGGTSMLFASRG